jgi:tetratricopeptide (TPR) repeat protein
VFAIILIVLGVTHWYIGKWGLGNMVSTRAEEPRIADVAVDMAPGDPQTHFAAAVLYDRTFIAADQERSLNEYETAVALSPNNYILWLEYGKALERNGDSVRAESALKRALDLAPNYAAVQWALGNLEVRNGETDSGFEQIKRAMEGDPQLAASAVAFAYQFFDGDLEQVRSVTGNVVAANSALAVLLARQKRYDEASVVWQAIGRYDSDAIVSSGRSLVNELISAKKFAEALKVSATIDTSSAFAAEKVTDGGFEEAVKLEGASPFDWQIGQGNQPQVLQSTSQPHGGERSLVLRYSSNDGNGLKSISQTVVVHPNTKYSITGFYHSDVKSDGKLVWQITDAASGAVIGESTLTPANGWTGFSVDFRLGNADAVVVQFMVKSCGSALCPISGSIWFDDIELKPV